MSEETIIMKGALEDHLGRIIYPDTAADQVMRESGKTVEESLSELWANFDNYLSKKGGTINGNVHTYRGNYSVNTWGCFSAGSDGTVVIAENAYKHPANNTYHFANSHETMGARGIVFQNGIKGVWYFDTGNIATTANAAFTPTLISITDKATKSFTKGDLNSLTENALVDGETMLNAPSGHFYYVQHITHSLSHRYATQIAYAFFSSDVYRRHQSQGVWSEWEPFLTPSNTPTQHYSTAAPTASDGKDGDVWDVYV